MPEQIHMQEEKCCHFEFGLVCMAKALQSCVMSNVSSGILDASASAVESSPPSQCSMSWASLDTPQYNSLVTSEVAMPMLKHQCHCLSTHFVQTAYFLYMEVMTGPVGNCISEISPSVIPRCRIIVHQGLMGRTQDSEVHLVCSFIHGKQTGPRSEITSMNLLLSIIKEPNRQVCFARFLFNTFNSSAQR